MKKFKTFKFIGLFLSLILTLVLLIGCEEEPILPEPVDVNYTVKVLNTVGCEISPSFTEVDAGAKLVLTVTAYPGYENLDSIYVNDTLMPLVNNTLILENISSDYNIKGISHMTEQMRLFTDSRGWVLFSYKTTWVEEGVSWEEDISQWQGHLNVTVYYPFFNSHYSSNNQYYYMETFDSSGVLIGQYQYQLKGDSIVYIEPSCPRSKIIYLSEDSLVVESISQLHDDNGVVDGYTFLNEVTYKHPDVY